MKAVVLHSGGMDSTTALAQAIDDGAESILTVSVRYGSLHMEAEQQAAEDVMKWFEQAHPHIEFQRAVIEMPAEIFKGEGSALMGETAMPHQTYAEINANKGPSPTVVPFRNANLISIATSIADARNYDLVYIGAHGEDAHEWAYPDCSPEFLGAMANAIYIGTYQKVRLCFPFIWMTKADIVVRALEVEAPIDLSWSCYNPVWVGPQIGENDITNGEYVHCGKCPTCIERAYAFALAGFIDPTDYNIPLEDIVTDAIIDSLDEWGER